MKGVRGEEEGMEGKRRVRKTRRKGWTDKGEGLKVKCGYREREREREWEGKGMESGKKQERDGKGKEEGAKGYGRWKERGRVWETKGKKEGGKGGMVKMKRVMKIERQNAVMVEGKRRGTGRGKNRM